MSGLSRFAPQGPALPHGADAAVMPGRGFAIAGDVRSAWHGSCCRVSC